MISGGKKPGLGNSERGEKGRFTIYKRRAENESEGSTMRSRPIKQTDRRSNERMGRLMNSLVMEAFEGVVEVFEKSLSNKRTRSRLESIIST